MPYKRLKNRTESDSERTYVVQYLGNVQVTDINDRSALDRIEAIDDDGHMSTLTVNSSEFTLNIRDEKVKVFNIRKVASMGCTNSRCFLTIADNPLLVSHVFDCHLADDCRQFIKVTFKRVQDRLSGAGGA